MKNSGLTHFGLVQKCFIPQNLTKINVKHLNEPVKLCRIEGVLDYKKEHLGSSPAGFKTNQSRKDKLISV